MSGIVILTLISRDFVGALEIGEWKLEVLGVRP